MFGVLFSGFRFGISGRFSLFGLRGGGGGIGRGVVLERSDITLILYYDTDQLSEGEIIS